MLLNYNAIKYFKNHKVTPFNGNLQCHFSKYREKRIRHQYQYLTRNKDFNYKSP